MYKVLERIILDRLIRHREETTRDELAGFRPSRSTTDQVFTVRRVIEVWHRYSKPLQLTDFTAAFDSAHRGRLLKTVSADGVPGNFVSLMNDMNRRKTAALGTPTRCTTPFELQTGVSQEVVTGPIFVQLCRR
ncbi:hypothetical protein RB195_014236 [Necator americanus]|uniref:Reverse transcriptase domain-containing protein n=1 Tax=Necator americanus TaxID=51031 RepID=A0ABR1DZ62_NECAM